jgi:formylglycine-generating enzyme required for sulfatase activity/thiol-disulfide isomerase/thioredoxin
MGSWEDAQLLCQWLTDREQAAGRLAAGCTYRLPSDHEWSCAVELGEKEDAAQLPSEKSQIIDNAFPWGAPWPPPTGAGNYAGEEKLSAPAAGKHGDPFVIAGYSDGFVNTSPVGRFAANRLGLFDMGGNVWQWCEDWFDKDQTRRVQRGASSITFNRNSLLSSNRESSAPDSRNYVSGFRCVFAPPSASNASPVVARVEAGSTAPETATKNGPFVNSLGMTFVPAPITGGPTSGQRVLFSVWDTRVQDYAIFAQETKREWPKEAFPQGPTHPAVNVTWDDAQLFCQWLTAREQAAGRLHPDWRYRLPGDHEWSCAVGLGAMEDAARLPSEKNGQIGDVFPWGPQWPPPAGAGNYAGEELQPAVTAGKYDYAKGVLAGYNDGYVNTSPVGSFAANQFGLFDMGGNVLQWCEDWFDTEQKTRVLRGSPWNYYVRSALLSATRAHFAPGARYHYYGFRCVLAPAASVLASKGRVFVSGQSIDLIALPGFDLGSARRPDSTIVRKEEGRLRIKGDKYSGSVKVPLDILGSEYELEVGVGNEFGAGVVMRIPTASGMVNVCFPSAGGANMANKQRTGIIISGGNAWPAGQSITLKLRVKRGAGGSEDELEAKVGNYPAAIWHGRLMDYQFEGVLTDLRLGLTIMHDVKIIDSFTLRMIQGEAKLLPPGALPSSPSLENRGANLAASGPTTPRPITEAATPRPVTDAGAPMDLKFTAVDGRTVDLATLRGKVVLVDFWASWCQPCLLEIPRVVEAYHKFHDKGFEIVGISFDRDKIALRRTTGQKRMTWPQYFDGKVWQNDYALKYGIHSIPTMWLIDKKGRVATTNGRNDLAGQVEKLLAGEAH